MGKWEMVRLSDVVDEAITGEWGTECTEGETGTKVLRTTNFTNLGIISYLNVVERNIPASKVQKKKLKQHDIILEKSGGSDNQPVGRVVFFDNDTDDVYLCNNFTQVLRIKQSLAFPRYVFLHLFRLHQNGTTELLQNKTTGIRNLQVKQYMSLKIPLPPLLVQKQIADVLDRASALIEKRKVQVDRLDLLVKSQFIEMFGDPVANPKGWEKVRFDAISKVRQGLQIPISKRKANQVANSFPYITVQYLNGNKQKEFIEKPKASVICTKDDILMTRTGNTGLVITNVEGVFHNNFFLIDYDRAQVDKQFLFSYLNTHAIQSELLRRAGTSTIPDLNHGEFYAIEIYLPPHFMQVQYADFVHQVEVQKSLLQQSLAKLELNYKSLMQKCFRGEMF